MKILKNYYSSIIKYELINKFNYKTFNKIPKLKKIILIFNCKSFDIKTLAISSLALEFISGQKSTINKSKRINILLKIRKGNPVGCKVSLRKQFMYLFLAKLVLEIFPRIKLFDYISYNDKLNNTTAMSFKISNIFLFPELEKNYYVFSQLTSLQVTLLVNSRTKNELSNMLNHLKIPLTL